MTALLGLLRLGLALVALGLSGTAVAAWFGFAVPIFDLFNHFQVPLIAGMLVALIGVLVLFIGSSWQLLLSVVLLAGLAASALTVVPERRSTIGWYSTRKPSSSRAWRSICSAAALRTASARKESAKTSWRSPPCSFALCSAVSASRSRVLGRWYTTKAIPTDALKVTVPAGNAKGRATQARRRSAR
jgi:uncharacterized membrane protein